MNGPELGPGSSGGPVWTVDANGPTVVGFVSSGGGPTGAGNFTKITAADRATILSWMAQDAQISPIVGWTDSTTRQSGVTAVNAPSGGPSYLQGQYIWTSSDRVNLLSNMPSVFLHGGNGQDVIQVTSGQNVLDGGAGSNFLTGGIGDDTFFTDARGTGPVCNTLRYFHVGDAAKL